MPEFAIVPYEHVGPIAFGMSREEVADALGGPPTRQFRRGRSSPPTEVFAAGSVQVSYTGDGRCEAVEFTDADVVCPVIGGFRPLGLPYAEVESFVMARDANAEVDGAGLRSLELGFAAHAPSASKEPEAPTESVMAFALGYWS